MIFIVGNSRSGTTMLGRVLGRNSQIHTFGELHFFEQLVDAPTVRQHTEWTRERLVALLQRLLTSSRDGCCAPVLAGKYEADAEEILARSTEKNAVGVYREFLLHETRRAGKHIPCEQTPRYLFFLDEILTLFPEARVINMVRDPRDVLISQKNKWKRRFLGARSIPLREVLRAWANYHPYLIAKLWASCVRQASRFENDPRVVTLRFEDLLAEPEATIRSLAEFVGVPFEPDMLRVPHVGSSTIVDKPGQFGINATRAGGWRQGGLSRHELAICEWAAGPEMRAHGYELAGMGRFQLFVLPSMAQLLFKLTLALPLNLSRSKNLMDTIKRRFFAGKPA